ncbi:MAG: hypothetical protein R3B06_23780 [Kofleriaceae bacterium]
MSRRVVAALVALGATTSACTGLRYTAPTNAPGVVVLAPPAREDGSPDLYVEPTDPGEHELYFGPGLVGGPALGRHATSDGSTGAELGVYLRVAYQTRRHSHRRDDVPMPAVGGYVLNVGWSPLQYNREAELGPVWAELERAWFVASVAVGVAVYPDDGNAGIQATVAAKPYGVRVRYLAETGFEVMGAFQVELPTAFSWSR